MSDLKIVFLTLLILVSVPALFFLLRDLLRPLFKIAKPALYPILDLWDVIIPLWLIILVTVIGMIALSIPQGRDLLISLAEESSRWPRFSFTFMAIFWAFTIWFSSAFTLLISPVPVLFETDEVSSEESREKSRKKIIYFERIVPHWLGLLSLLSVILIVSFHRQNYAWLTRWSFLLLLFTIVMWLTIIYLEEIFKLLRFPSQWLPKDKNNLSFFIPGLVPDTEGVDTSEINPTVLKILYTYFGISVIFNFIFLFNLNVSEYLGAAAILILGCTLWTSIPVIIHYLVTKISDIRKKSDKNSNKLTHQLISHRIMTLSTIVLLVFLYIFSGFNNNHSIRFIANVPNITDKRASLSTFLEEWVKDTNKHHRSDSKSKYDSLPLILISSEGGGLRSAYWTASLLSHMQDTWVTTYGNRGFSDHIFALSGVSGGCVGEMFYIAGLIDTKNPKDLLSPRIKASLSGDFLTPVVSKLVFPEILQSLIPFPIRRADRASALEQSWEESWGKSRGGCNTSIDSGNNCIRNGFLNSYSLASLSSDTQFRWRTDVPLLFCNGTWVETGKRTVVSPVKLSSTGSTAIDLLSITKTDVPFSTAALLSARFPLISPGARIMDSTGIWGHVVDGGYYENSGTMTTLDILNAIINSNTSLPIKPYVIIIRNNTVKRTTPLLYINEFREPIHTLFNIRTENVEASIAALKSKIDKNQIIEFNMDLDSYDVPLGWCLSQRARGLVDSFIVSKKMKSSSLIKQQTDTVFNWLK